MDRSRWDSVNVSGWLFAVGQNLVIIGTMSIVALAIGFMIGRRLRGRTVDVGTRMAGVAGELARPESNPMESTITRLQADLVARDVRIEELSDQLAVARAKSERRPSSIAGAILAEAKVQAAQVQAAEAADANDVTEAEEDSSGAVPDPADEVDTKLKSPWAAAWDDGRRTHPLRLGAEESDKEPETLGVGAGASRRLVAELRALIEAQAHRLDNLEREINGRRLRSDPPEGMDLSFGDTSVAGAATPDVSDGIGGDEGGDGSHADEVDLRG